MQFFQKSTRFGLRQVQVALLLVVVLAALPAASAPQTVEKVGRISPQTTTRSLRGNPNFNANDLPPQVRVWYDRMWKDLRAPNPLPDLKKLGATGDLWELGRPWNRGITGLLAVFRVTGDLRLLDEIDAALQLARGQLKDPDGDGFLNWLFLDTTNVGLTGHDRESQMWDMETHALVAAAAYAFRVNQDLKSPAGIDYRKRADFWQNYLKNHFEAKWRKRNNQPTGFPFLEKPLIHPYSHFIRYHHYMAKLTGDPSYADYAKVMAERLAKYSYEVETPAGVAMVWRHQTLDGDNTAQPIGYGSMTLAAFQDLNLEGFEPYSSPAVIEKYARTVSELIMLDGANSFAKDIAGEVPRAGLKSKPRVGVDGRPGQRMTPAGYAVSQLPFFAAWDDAGKIARISMEVDANLRRPDEPRRYLIPAAMVFSQLFRLGYQK